MISGILALVTIFNRIFYWTIISVLRKYVRGIRKFGAKHLWVGVTIFLRNALVGAKTTGWQKPGQTSLIHPLNITNFQILQYSKAIPLPPTEHIFTHRMQHDKTGLLDLWLIDLWQQNNPTSSLFITIQSEMGIFAIISTALLFGRRMNRKSLQLIKSALCYHGIPGSILLNSFSLFWVNVVMPLFLCKQCRGCF